jgi:hypothetical protein
MPEELATYLRESAARLREIANERPAMAQKLRNLADSMELKAAEIEAAQGDASSTG